MTEYNTAGAVLSESSIEGLKLLIEAMPQVVWTANPDGNLDFCNQRWFEYTGLTPEQTHERGWKSILHPDDLESDKLAWNNALKTGTFYEVRHRLRRASDGTYRWHLGRAQAIRDENGVIKKWVGTCTDFDDQKKAVENADRQQQKLKAFLSSFPFVLWATDKEGIVTLSEGKGLSSTVGKPRERVGMDMLKVKGSTDEYRNNVKRALAGESFQAMTCYNGRWAETFYSPLIGENGAIEGVVAISSDITEQRMALTESKVAYWDLHLKTGQVSYLGGLKELYGRPDSKPLRNLTEFLEIVHPEDRNQVNKAIEHCVKYKVPFETMFRIVWTDGSIHWLHGKGTLICDDEGEPIKLTGVNIDCTDQKMVEVALARAEQAKNQLMISERAAIQASTLKSNFLANMSHEIRTPINGVIGMTSLLLATHLDDKQLNYAETIRISADTLLTLINDILDLSKAEAGKTELEIIEFELEEVISDIERTLTFEVKKKNLKFFKSISPEIPNFLKGDPTRLRQVLVNLVSNAIKFTPSGQVTIEAQLRERTQGKVDISFEITDTGIGIPQEALSRMFQAFSQADSSTTRKFGGTGLGLSISKHLVKLMGGEIGVKSEEGKGTTFWFTVPLLVGKSCPKKASRAHIPASPPKKLRILIAEDSSVNQRIVMNMLEYMGHVGVAVANGCEAIEALKTGHYDLVFMDCQMPELDGYEATKMIRSSGQEEYKNIPITAFTAHAMRGDRERCFEAGMNDYVSKPIKIEDLEAAIQRYSARTNVQEDSSETKLEGNS